MWVVAGASVRHESKHSPNVMTKKSSSSSRAMASFGGWAIPTILGFGSAWLGYPTAAVGLVAAVGLLCSLKGFNGCEMPLAMIIFTALGILLLPLTTWAWVAPMLPAGFMVSVAFG